MDFDDMDECPFEMEEPNYDEEPDYEYSENRDFLDFSEKEAEPTNSQSKTKVAINENIDKMFENVGVKSYKEKQVQKENIPVKEVVPEFNNIKEINNQNKKKEKIEKTEQKDGPDKTVECRKTEYDMSFEEETYLRNMYYEYEEYNDDTEYIDEAYYESLEETEERTNYSSADKEVLETIESMYNTDNSENTQKELQNKILVINTNLLKEKIKFFKTPAIFIVMVFLVFVIPVITTSGRGKNLEENDLSSESIEINIDEDLYKEAEKQVSYELSETSYTGRFANIDELTLYIDSNTGSILSSEIQLVNKYNSGIISKDEFIKQMTNYIEDADAVNHLLLVNKEAYTNEGKSLKYEEMRKNMDVLLLYGDTALIDITQ